MQTLQKPRIALFAADHERLSALADAAMYNDPETAEMLSEELDRARVITGDRVLKEIVRMGSEVLFRDDATRTIRQITLVFPSEADITRNKISVLTPVGSALIGLRTGQSISWRMRNGEIKRLTVLKVIDAQEHNRGSCSREIASFSA